jgi:hypothetical protein
MLKQKAFVFQVITAISAAVISVLAYSIIDHSFYSSGAANNYPPIDPIGILLWLCQFLFLIISLIIFFCIFSKIKKIQLCISAASLIISIIICYLYISPGGPGTFFKGFETWVNKNVDSNSIQAWIKTADEKYWQTEVCYVPSVEKPVPEELPAFLKNINFRCLKFQRSELDGSKILHFMWGGVFFHWNLIIGDSKMKMPVKTIEKFSDGDVEFRRIIRPGVYIYSRE